MSQENPELSLTEGQKAALQQIQLFLNSRGSGVFLLKGYAGTGKTTLLQYLAASLKKEKKKFTLLAPTGRAATVLRAKTGFEASTIHSELYTFFDIDGDPDDSKQVPETDEFGQMRLIFTIKSPDPTDTRIYIVDEASMISDNPSDPTSYAHFGSGRLLSDLLAAAGTNKIIFAGDPCQLPPVGSINSPALSETYMRNQGKVVQSFELKQILRQKEHSGILKLASKVRTLSQGRFENRFVKLPAKGVRNVQLTSYSSLKDLYIYRIKENGFNNQIAVCHSNLNCMDINKAVREELYNSKNVPIQVGDLLMITQNNHMVPLTNGDFVVATHIGERRKYLGIQFLEITVQAQLSGQSYQTLLCEEVLYNGQANLTMDQQRTLMIDFSKRMRAKGIKRKSETYLNALQKDPYLNSLRANFGYAVTCHKSQGGEWDEVYLFLHKGMYVMEPKELTRWWYTGITRAKNNLLIVDNWWVV